MTNSVTTAALETWIRAFARLVAENKDELTQLDAAIGDADHGANMDRGLSAVVVTLDAALAAGADLEEALQAASRAADEGCLATIPLIARKGRASYLGERSAGHQDPGATTVTLLFRAATPAGLP